MSNSINPSSDKLGSSSKSNAQTDPRALEFKREIIHIEDPSQMGKAPYWQTVYTIKERKEQCNKKLEKALYDVYVRDASGADGRGPSSPRIVRIPDEVESERTYEENVRNPYKEVDM